MGEKGKEAVWKEISCLEGKLILTVPKNWERIVGKKVDGLFPYANQPQMVMGTLEEEKLFTLNLLSKGLEEGQVNGAIREIQRVILRVYPESCRQGIRRRRLKAGITGWFSFSTGAGNRYCSPGRAARALSSKPTRRRQSRIRPSGLSRYRLQVLPMSSATSFFWTG